MCFFFVVILCFVFFRGFLCWFFFFCGVFFVFFFGGVFFLVVVKEHSKISQITCLKFAKFSMLTDRGHKLLAIPVVEGFFSFFFYLFFNFFYSVFFFLCLKEIAMSLTGI